MPSPASSNDDAPSADSLVESVHILPPPPDPAADTELHGDKDAIGKSYDHDVFKISPLAALKLLCAEVETLVHITGDVPPTPPLSQPHVPHMRGIQAEKENIARHTSNSWGSTTAKRPRTPSSSSGGSDDIDGVTFKKTPPLNLHARPNPSPYLVIGADAEPLNIQHGAITRKFYSKQPPPISLEDYLTRIHKFCPMSTAVYLACSVYIHRLAVVERAIPVASRNSHRLVLAGLRVAMKALEDLSYPHRRFAKVGGVSELELARLEISFCFLTNFDLRIREGDLWEHAKGLEEIVAVKGKKVAFGGLKMPRREGRTVGFRAQETVPEVAADA